MVNKIEKIYYCEKERKKIKNLAIRKFVRDTRVCLCMCVQVKSSVTWGKDIIPKVDMD